MQQPSRLERMDMLKKQLEEEDVIKWDDESGTYIFLKDYAFNSKEDAATFILGYESDGSEWVQNTDCLLYTSPSPRDS